MRFALPLFLLGGESIPILVVLTLTRRHTVVRRHRTGSDHCSRTPTEKRKKKKMRSRSHDYSRARPYHSNVELPLTYDYELNKYSIRRHMIRSWRVSVFRLSEMFVESYDKTYDKTYDM